ncbi:hypothetical protein IW15_22765 [Chryseobacterium soli]|uniref:Uncharacterized protein n=1 Tax=Chryseobacterium soli TaxID=445961 RepID=A0A085ZUS3_9FLAO|nr:hypothetical protein IW15_22765 [Chryseobacterium soli]
MWKYRGLSVNIFEKLLKGIVPGIEKWSKGIDYNKNEGKNIDRERFRLKPVDIFIDQFLD